MTRLTPKAIIRDRLRRTTAWRRLAPAGLALALLAGPGVLRAAEDKLPAAEVILDKYVEATGGKVAYAKLTNRVTKATFEIAAQGVKFSVTSYEARPNKFYSLMESESLGKFEEGTDGEVVWEISAMRGPQIKEGEEKALVLRNATFDGDVTWRKLFKKAECVGIETIDGKPCYKVVMTPNEGQRETRYYDKASGLLARAEMTLTLPMGTFPFEIYHSDYKRVDGILLPHKTRVRVMGSERIVTTQSIEHNVELPADRFELPAAIQALVDGQKKKPGVAPKQTQTEKGAAE